MVYTAARRSALRLFGLGLSLLIGLSAGLPFAGAESFAPLPPLLQARVTPKTELVMVTFYATWCGACKRMRPFETAMVKNAGSKLKAFWVDVDQPQQAELVKRYGVNGTPTYFLFDRNGKPLFTMNRYLSAPVLQAEVKRFTGRSKTSPMLDIPSQGKPLILILAHPNKDTAIMDRLGAVAQQKLEVRMDSVRHAQLAGSRALLLDRKGRELYRASAGTDDSTVSDYLELFIAGEP